MILPTEGKIMSTVLFCSNAAGRYMSPYVIYKGLSAKVFDTRMIGGPEGTSYNVTKSGWMKKTMLTMFLKHGLKMYF